MPINYLAVLVASVINMVLGMLWYGPLFGKPWMRMIGANFEERIAGMQSAAGKNKMYRSMVIAFILALIFNLALAHVIALFAFGMGISGITVGLVTGLIIWLGFALLITSGSYLWETKPLNLWALNAAYYLVLLLINGALIGCWM